MKEVLTPYELDERKKSRRGARSPFPKFGAREVEKTETVKSSTNIKGGDLVEDLQKNEGQKMLDNEEMGGEVTFDTTERSPGKKEWRWKDPNEVSNEEEIFGGADELKEDEEQIERYFDDTNEYISFRLKKMETRHGKMEKDFFSLSTEDLQKLWNYLFFKTNVEDNFRVMTAVKRLAGENDNYSRLKKAWEVAKNNLEEFQLSDIEPEKIGKVKNVLEFIRKFNLGILTAGDRKNLMKCIQDILDLRMLDKYMFTDENFEELDYEEKTTIKEIPETEDEAFKKSVEKARINAAKIDDVIIKMMSEEIIKDAEWAFENRQMMTKNMIVKDEGVAHIIPARRVIRDFGNFITEFSNKIRLGVDTKDELLYVYYNIYNEVAGAFDKEGLSYSELEEMLIDKLRVDVRELFGEENNLKSLNNFTLGSLKTYLDLLNERDELLKVEEWGGNIEEEKLKEIEALSAEYETDEDVSDKIFARDEEIDASTFIKFFEIKKFDRSKRLMALKAIKQILDYRKLMASKRVNGMVS